MIFGIGLPRSAGQTLQNCLGILGHNTIHSPGNKLAQCASDGFESFVEVFAPVSYLLDTYGLESVFILNFRDVDPWMNSCHRVYSKSAGWNHPIWKYELDQFPAYRADYEACQLDSLKIANARYLTWDITTYPFWDAICDFLGVDEPDVEFPNVDNHGRASVDVIQPNDNLPSPW
jgi:hypothetical protein